jgi:hypothetical protein
MAIPIKTRHAEAPPRTLTTQSALVGPSKFKHHL